MFETITIEQAGKWDSIVKSMHSYDFYHLSAYHRLDTSGKAVLLHIQTEKTNFALPVLFRNVEGTDYKDITSVYGYAGPLASQTNPAQEDIRRFQNELKAYCDTHKIISVFARLHPLFENQSEWLDDLGNVNNSNLTVAIDLTLSEKEQRKQYARSLRYRINALKRKNVQIIHASNKQETDTFIDIYRETMDRVNASPQYYFSNEYFYRFLTEIDSCLYLAVYNNQIISGSLCTFSGNGIMQAHLNATRSACLPISPLKLVLDEARLDGIKRGMLRLHLGGGKGGSNDSLFIFKSRFSHLHFQFKTWRYVHNPQAYNRMLRNQFGENIPQTDFFPLYRLNTNRI
ncbi:MAG: peptidoglycan bridge formation glycyltransferase FemA/FemB family protein [Candidatus Symbiothrix sp.]|jgi:hypothetical protein|nr:peptidoglycan bridge formation glycyltransferase FemA/FemB family protein [Candidatus Symbiothrix sp.]